MSDFNKDNISNYSWIPDKNAEQKIEIGASTEMVPVAPVSQKSKKGSRIAFAAIVVAICVVFSGLSAFAGTYIANRLSFPADVLDNEGDGTLNQDATEAGKTPSRDSVTINKVESDGTLPSKDDMSLVSAIVEKTGNAVVEITTETVVGGSRFSQYVTSGAGSGVIVAKEGYIITNYHVIDGADNVLVRTNDGTEYKAEIIGSDSSSDIAVLKIDAADKELTVVTVGDSDTLIVGETVIAIGNPLGELGGSVTDGIISALNREIEIDGQTMTLLQHNAAVNPGNSGGALFNARGELIGIVNAKSSGEDIEGIGFAIPVNEAIEVMKSLVEHGYVRGRVYLGLNLIDIQDTYTAMYYRVNTLGLYVMESEFIEDLKQGDRISAVDGEEVTSYSDMKSILSKKNVGDEIIITVVRNGKFVDVKAVCREYTPDENAVDFEE